MCDAYECYRFSMYQVLKESCALLSSSRYDHAFTISIKPSTRGQPNFTKIFTKMLEHLSHPYFHLCLLHLFSVLRNYQSRRTFWWAGWVQKVLHPSAIHTLNELLKSAPQDHLKIIDNDWMYTWLVKIILHYITILIYMLYYTVLFW